MHAFMYDTDYGQSEAFSYWNSMKIMLKLCQVKYWDVWNEHNSRWPTNRDTRQFVVIRFMKQKK